MKHYAMSDYREKSYEALDRIVERIELPGLKKEPIDFAKEIMEYAVVRNQHYGKPRAFAASAIYLASILKNDYRSQRDIAKAAKITKTAISQNYRQMAKSEGLSIPCRDL